MLELASLVVSIVYLWTLGDRFLVVLSHLSSHIEVFSL